MESPTYYNSRHFDIGMLILRVVLGIIILLHGINKVNAGIGSITQHVSASGLPEFIAYGVYIGEVIAPIMLILGLFTRLGGLIIVINIIFAICLAHMNLLFSLKDNGGYALELQIMFLVVAMVIAIIGGGRFAILKRFN